MRATNTLVNRLALTTRRAALAPRSVRLAATSTTSKGSFCEQVIFIFYFRMQRERESCSPGETITSIVVNSCLSLCPPSLPKCSDFFQFILQLFPILIFWTYSCRGLIFLLVIFSNEVFILFIVSFPLCCQTSKS